MASNCKPAPTPTPAPAKPTAAAAKYSPQRPLPLQFRSEIQALLRKSTRGSPKEGSLTSFPRPKFHCRATLTPAVSLPLSRIHLQQNKRQIVILSRIRNPRIQFRQHPSAIIIHIPMRQPPQQFLQPILAVLLVRRIQRLRYSIREHYQHIARQSSAETPEARDAGA